MLLELCDMALKDWLADITDVTTDVLENMLMFTLNIAHAIDHIHSVKITHRRLGARNVLLKQSAGGLEAKLIGLSTPVDDSDKVNGQSAGQETVPLKWLAPETLSSLSSRKPIYNEKTDAWSFAVTIWEIYSTGMTPYPDKKSNDVRGLIQKGYRLPCPENCPPELFERVLTPCWSDSPKKRPSFKVICSSIEEFRHGSSAAGDGYYAAEDRSLQYYQPTQQYDYAK